MLNHIKLDDRVKFRLKKHALYVEGALTHPFEALHMGNGDIGANVNFYPHEVKITLAKSDIWDARYDGRPEESVLKHDDLIKMMRKRNHDLEEYIGTPKGDEDYLMESPAYHAAPYNTGPAPKRAGAIRLYHPGLSNTKVSGRLDILTGVLTVRFGFAKGELIVRAFIQRGENLVWVELESVGETPWMCIILEKEPDESDRDMPKPVVRMSGPYLGGVGQVIPAGFGIKEFCWDIAGAFPYTETPANVFATTAQDSPFEAREVEVHAYRLRQFCEPKPGHRARFCVAVATSRDGGANTYERAVSMLENSRNRYEECLKSHIEAWEDYWAASGIELDDEELEATWYRNHFAYGCSLQRDAVVPPGSCANLTIQDSVPWHGDCHMNHNFQKWYVTALPTNHPEWIDICADFIEEKMPIFEYQAKLIFGLEGVYCDLSYLPVMDKDHCHISNLHGRALAITGWMCQPLWWHWEYLHDKEWLRTRGYPYIKKAAKFYYNYLEKYQDESGHIYPSIRIEEPGWKKDFIGNRDVISDLVMFKKTFEWAIAASEVLETDEAWRGKWEEGLKRVAPVRCGWDGEEAFVALDAHWDRYGEGTRADLSRCLRWAGGGWAVFPGEYIAGDGDDELTRAYRDILSRTDLLNPFYSKTYDQNMYPGVPIVHPISSILPAVRLGLRDQFDSIRQVILRHRLTTGQACSYMLSDGEVPREIKGYGGYLWYDWRAVENKYLGVIATTEMLLQSQESVIRLFPLWPRGRMAAFTRLRARGGFVVSASLESDGRITAEIESVAGLPCRIRTNGAVAVIRDGTPISVERQDCDIVFDTEKDGVYHVGITVK